jgi:glycosyltransferase involved in cell wall biosynthesis
LRFHIPAIPGQQTTYGNSVCAYTQKIMKFCDMMIPRGHEVFIYSGPEFDGKCTEHFNVYEDAEYDGFDVARWLPHNQKATPIIKENFEEGDYLLLIAGLAQKSISDAIEGFRVVEFGIGYQGVFAEFKVFESYAWMHTVYGENQGAYAANGNFYDTVIHNYFDIKDFEDNGGNGDYFLYIGRLLERKGVHIASEVCDEIGANLKIAGEGEFKPEYGEYLGNVGPCERKDLMSNAKAVFVPSLYLEPFGGVVIEAMLSGCPVITVDWGAMSETVIDQENGYRCKTFGDFLWAANNCHKLDRNVIREYASHNFSLGATAPKYESYFEQVEDLAKDGWYTKESRKYK